MRKEVEKLNEMFSATPPKWDEIETLLRKNTLSQVEMAELAYSVADICFCEYRDALDCNDQDESKIDPAYLHNTYLLQSLKMLLQHGLNPNAETESSCNVMYELVYADCEAVAANAMRLLLENGANPNLKIRSEGESVFENVDFDVSCDLWLGTSFYRRSVQCWLVLMAYGACYSDGKIPIKMLNQYSVSIFKNFEYYDYNIEMLPQQAGYYGCWIMHIFDTRTGEEVAIYE